MLDEARYAQYVFASVLATYLDHDPTTILSLGRKISRPSRQRSWQSSFFRCEPSPGYNVMRTVLLFPWTSYTLNMEHALEMSLKGEESILARAIIKGGSKATFG